MQLSSQSILEHFNHLKKETVCLLAITCLCPHPLSNPQQCLICLFVSMDFLDISHQWNPIILVPQCLVLSLASGPQGSPLCVSVLRSLLCPAFSDLQIPHWSNGLNAAPAGGSQGCCSHALLTLSWSNIHQKLSVGGEQLLVSLFSHDPTPHLTSRRWPKPRAFHPSE